MLKANIYHINVFEHKLNNDKQYNFMRITMNNFNCLTALIFRLVNIITSANLHCHVANYIAERSRISCRSSFAFCVFLRHRQ